MYVLNKISNTLELVLKETECGDKMPTIVLIYDNLLKMFYKTGNSPIPFMEYISAVLRSGTSSEAYKALLLIEDAKAVLDEFEKSIEFKFNVGDVAYVKIYGQSRRTYEKVYIRVIRNIKARASCLPDGSTQREISIEYEVSGCVSERIFIVEESNLIPEKSISEYRGEDKRILAIRKALSSGETAVPGAVIIHDKIAYIVP